MSMKYFCKSKLFCENCVKFIKHIGEKCNLTKFKDGFYELHRFSARVTEWLEYLKFL